MVVRPNGAEVGWPGTREGLEALQHELAGARPPPWRIERDRELRVAGTFVASPTGLVGVGDAGDPLWVAAVLVRIDLGRGTLVPSTDAVVRGRAGAPYEAGYLALREGALLERAVRALGDDPDVVLVNATGRDHPRGAGLTLHLGAVLDVPTVGVTDRPLLAGAVGAGDGRGAETPLRLGDAVVGAALRTRGGARPVLAHAGWRTDPDVARDVVMLSTGRARTPEPIRRARRLAREARAVDEGRAPAAEATTG